MSARGTRYDVGRSGRRRPVADDTRGGTMHRTLALAACLLALPATAAGDRALERALARHPHFTTAHASLLQAGWRPRVTHLRLESRSGLPILARLRGLARVFYFDGHAEVEECGSAGTDRCTFNYRDAANRCLRVYTRGATVATAIVDGYALECPPDAAL